MPTTRKQKRAWGYHLVLNGGQCDPVALRSKETIIEFSNTLVKAIDMVKFGEPRVVRFGHGNKKGFTLVQLIETSNITAHFVETSNDIYLDVFSCKPFSAETVQRVFSDFFQPKYVDVTFLKRQARRS